MIDEKAILKEILTAPAPLAVSQMARRFNIKGAQRRELRALLAQLVHQGKIVKIRGKNYAAPSGRSGHILGRLEVTSKGFGFVRPDWSNFKDAPPFEGDLFIPPHAMNGAMDGDVVRAEFLRSSKEGASGRIEEVLERAHTRVVGRYRPTNRTHGEVIPRNTRLDRRIDVPLPDKELGIKDHEWVEVEIEEFTAPPAALVGRVISRLGHDEDKGIDVLLVLRDKGIIEEFPESVEEYIKDLRFHWDEDLKGRQDYRELPTVTIDPETAKDYDDGLSVEKLPDGGWRLYVHIADVSHFLEPDSPLDREAVERSTSVYPIDRVVPMLPNKLSNYLCSLVPNEDRLTMTAVMEISPRGELLSKKVYSSVIYSDHRLTYEQVQKTYDGETGETAAFKQLLPLLNDLQNISRVLRKARFRRGALDLDIPELRIIFDENGASKDINFYKRFEAHKVVEECMLIANEAVAQLLTEKEAPLLYRIHETADEARLEKLDPVLQIFGIKITRHGGEITPKDIQKAIEAAQDKPAGHILRRLVLRALKRAEYSPDNMGHFGLASECYCHFTSPIRRYPDVVVHRQLKALEKDHNLPYAADDEVLDDLGDHTSRRERRAQDAEFETTKIKALEFMKQFEGEEFEGYISGVQSFGIFIELEQYPVDGLVKIATLTSDYYVLDDTGTRLVGKRSGHVLKLAEKVKVRIDKVDPWGQIMDLSLLGQPAPTKGRRGQKPKKKYF